MSSYYNPATELTYELGADGIWRVEIGSGSAESLHYLGSITPPTDPATLIADPKDGDFYIYDSDGTAWNGEAVVAGYWVVFNPANGWQNVGVKITTGVEEVDVSGGVLTLAGTASKPVINLDKLDVQNALDDRYLEVDGSNTFTGDSLQMQATGGGATKINDNNGLELCTGNVARLSVAPTKITVNEDLDLNNAKQITFKGSSGNRLNMEGSRWGALSSDGTRQLEWGGSGLKLHVTLNANSLKIEDLADPTNAQDAATMAYVDSKDYVLPKATADDLGGVKIGDSLTMSLDGTLDVDPDGTFLPLTGGTLSGYTKVQGALFKIRYDSAGTAGEFKFYSKDDQNIVRMVGGDTAAEGYMTYAGKCDAGGHVLSRDHGDARYLKLTGGTLTGSLSLEIDSSTSSKKGFIIKGKDASGTEIELLHSYHQNDSSRTTADAVNYKGRTDNSDNLINRAALDAALASVSGAELATKTTAGTVKVNVTTSETAGIDAVYREGAGKLFVRKATTGTNNSTDASGAQRGVAAFHSDTFSASNGFITLKAGTTSKIGGVKASSSSTDVSAAFVIGSDGVGKIRNNTSSTVGVSKRGQICTSSGSPNASDYVAGQMVMRTDTKAVYIKV